MENRRMICIECPRGCEMDLEIENGAVKDVKGNFCAKGRQYAVNECTRPLRGVTTTVRLISGEMLPVKTSKGVLKKDVIATAKKISALRLEKPVKIGQVIEKNIDGENTDVIATASIL